MLEGLWALGIKRTCLTRVPSIHYHSSGIPSSSEQNIQREGESQKDAPYNNQLLVQSYYFKNNTKLKEKQKLYNRNNKELIKKQKREYYLKNKQTIKEKQRCYRVHNKEAIQRLNQQYRSQHKHAHQIKEAQARYRAKHKERLQEASKQYYLNNKVSLNLQNKVYRLQHKFTLMEKKRLKYFKEREWVHHINKQYYVKNKDSISVKNKEYYLRNKLLINQRNREYYLNNKDLFQLHRRQYYVVNRNFIKLKNTLYYLTNKHAIKENVSRKRQLKPTKSELFKDPQYLSLFLGYASGKLFIRDELDWYRISHLQMNGIGGGSVLTGFGNLGRALDLVYPEIQWIQSKFSIRRKKAIQRWLRVILQQILPPDTLILEDYLHPDLLWGSSNLITNQRMELDIWVPKYNLALEYQGEQHYYHHSFYGSWALLKDRDEEKKRSCFERGITLITIPYWWDRTKESLADTLRTYPQLF
eukprot:TRINITY_DN1090_c0_g1_i1.p1 TRINITY_DN1090_c0_g1~~TRINITY_DN1090_c0_g1_i1.p1  ORF type:complete len:471 (+),score=82.73 TRINITY_DN1090_c0_g1_i1:123-1535(+)